MGRWQQVQFILVAFRSLKFRVIMMLWSGQQNSLWHVDALKKFE